MGASIWSKYSCKTILHDMNHNVSKVSLVKISSHQNIDDLKKVDTKIF